MPATHVITSPEARLNSQGQWMVLLAAFLGWMFDGYEIGLFPLIARPALRHLLSDPGDAQIGQWMGIITACFLIGAALGGLVFGWLGDRIGRVKAMALSILTYSLVTGFGYFAHNPEQLGVVRFLSALGMGGQWSLGVALVMECWPEKWRPMLAGAMGAAANVGFLLVGVTARLHQVTPESWRWMMLVAALPAFLVVFIMLAVPESARWQQSVSSGRSQPLREIFAPGLRGRCLLAIVFASVALIGTWGSVQWLPLWANQMVSQEGGQTLRAQHPNWYAAANGALPPATAEAKKAAETTVKQQAGKASANMQMIQGFGAIVGTLLAPLIGARLGRRPAYFLLCLTSLAVCAVTFRTTVNYTSVFLAWSFLMSLTTASFYGWFPLYLPELFPTRVRATGQGLSYNFGRVFAAVGALTQGQLVSTFGGSYARAGAVVTLIYLVGMAVIWFAPETKGKPLPE
ncbi:MAG TPA: MFS transporter [Candidatus Eisenbacteria bacterium]|nr:MFS transporter [Candidatus Eisenbacteria bacterium]